MSTHAIYVMYTTPCSSTSVDIYYSDGSVRHNVGDDGLSDEDRTAMGLDFELSLAPMED